MVLKLLTFLNVKLSEVKFCLFHLFRFMPFDFQSLSKIDKRTKYSVNGWIRKLEQSLQLNHISIISDIIILFFRDDEIFDNETGIASNNCIISKDGKTVTRTDKTHDDNWDNNSYGEIEIPSTEPLIYKWDLKTCKAVDDDSDAFRSGILIGVSSDISPDNDFEGRKGYHYCYLHAGSKYDGQNNWNSYGCSYGSNDIVSMEMNLKRAEMRFYVNNQDQGVAYTNIKNDDADVKYRLLVSLYSSGDSVEIVNFSKKDG